MGSRDEIIAHGANPTHRIDDPLHAKQAIDAMGDIDVSTIKTTPHEKVLDEERRIALAEHHDRRARYVRAAAVTGEDYSDLIGEVDTEIVKLKPRRTIA